MSQKVKYKICLIGDSLAGGGAEKVHALLSNYFVSKGIAVSHVIVQDEISYDYSGDVLNLGKYKNQSNGIFNKFSRLLKLKSFLDKNQFDYIIDSRVKNRSWQEWITARLLYKSPAVFIVHSADPQYYFPASSALARSIHQKAFGIVTVSNGMRKLLQSAYGFKKVDAIHNPVDIDKMSALIPQKTPHEARYILAVGRMDDNIKQFDTLIISYSKSVLPEQNIKLLILGKGMLQQKLQQLVLELNLAEQVVFKGFLPPAEYMANALFLVSTSESEGFGNVLVESLACGTPVIAFDCDFGPAEIIVHRENGLLVTPQNSEDLTDAMNLFVTDKLLYNHCKSNARPSSEKFSLAVIGRQWLDYLKIDVS